MGKWSPLTTSKTRWLRELRRKAVTWCDSSLSAVLIMERKAAKTANTAKAARWPPDDTWQCWQPWQPSAKTVLESRDTRCLDGPRSWPHSGRRPTRRRCSTRFSAPGSMSPASTSRTARPTNTSAASRGFREAAERVGKFAAVLADLPGPKLRVKMPAPRSSTTGDTVSFSLAARARRADDLDADRAGDRSRTCGPASACCSTTAGCSSKRSRRRRAAAWRRVVLVGGTLQPNKGLNLPDTPLTIPAVTDRDREAHRRRRAKPGSIGSRCRSCAAPRRPTRCAAACAAVGLNVPVLAKIERPEAVDRAAAIVAAFDARHGRPRRPRRRDPAGAGADRAEDADRRGPRRRQAGHHRDRHARLDARTTRGRPAPRPATSPTPSTTAPTRSCSPARRRSASTRSRRSRACTASPVETETYLKQSGVRVGADAIAPKGEIDDPISVAACDLMSKTDAAAIVTPTLSGRTAQTRRIGRGRGLWHLRRMMQSCGVCR